MITLQANGWNLISVKMTKINPERNNKDDTLTTTLCMMADSGAMCSLLNYETVNKMGIDPESLDKSAVSITGVNGKNCNLRLVKCM